MAPLSRHSFVKIHVRRLQLLVKVARRARNINSARNPALPILHPLHNPGRLRALRTIRALVRIHDLCPVACLCNLCHLSLSMFLLMWLACVERRRESDRHLYVVDIASASWSPTNSLPHAAPATPSRVPVCGSTRRKEVDHSCLTQSSQKPLPKAGSAACSILGDISSSMN
jgi:hypothetical protein